jgi:hypothetical protein
MTVNKGSRTGGSRYFQVNIEGAGANPFLSNGAHKAWCLEWRKPMRLNSDVHEGVKWYSSTAKSKQRSLNCYFTNCFCTSLFSDSCFSVDNFCATYFSTKIQPSSSIMRLAYFHLISLTSLVPIFCTFT